jgi:UDP-N-acetylmuramyl pentapeptide phosphotransferase/UDP-N-acetylglucosamine-1-phosphate transferase
MINFNIVHLLIFFTISFFITSIIFKILKKNKLYDVDILNFNKSASVITSLGISFLICFFIILYYYVYEKSILEVLPNRYYIFFGSLIILSLVSLWDDIKEIDPKLRLIIQLILVYFSLTNLDFRSLNFPPKLIIFLALVFWVYIINITNFIDGSDGHCAVHAIFFFIGTIYISYNFKLDTFSYYLALINLPIMLTFLNFNKPPAIAYMGDTGSIFLGYIIGFIILENIFLFKGLYFISIFLYPILDCTLTLIKKSIKGIYPWVKLGDYFFLLPIRNGRNHKKVFYASLIYNILNLFFIFLQIDYSSFFFGLNILSAIILLLYFKSFKYEK